MIKAIETEYDGYRFRSRLEARWAVFFKTLGIKYEYEKEGYDLDGTWYLPDFWLPDLDCFIEIKGQEPTSKEINKAFLLSLVTNKYVYLFRGDVWMPDTDIEEGWYKSGDDYTMYHWERAAQWFNSYYGLSIWGENTSSSCGSQKTCEHGDDCPNLCEIEKPEYAPLITALYRTECNSRYGDSCKLRITQDSCMGPKILQYLVPTYEDKTKRKFTGRVPAPLPPIIKQHEQEFIELFSAKDDTWEWGVGSYAPFLGEDGYVWCECVKCGFTIISRGAKGVHDFCPKCQEPDLTADTEYSERLLAAYKAARSARFEHGEKG